MGADGILWELRGIVDGIYPLGRIDVLVPLEELDAARQCLVADEAGGSPAPPADGPDGEIRPGETAGPIGEGSRRWWMTAAVIAGALAFSAIWFVAAVSWLEGDRRDGCSARAAEGLTARCRD